MGRWGVGVVLVGLALSACGKGGDGGGAVEGGLSDAKLEAIGKTSLTGMKTVFSGGSPTEGYSASYQAAEPNAQGVTLELTTRVGKCGPMMCREAKVAAWEEAKAELPDRKSLVNGEDGVDGFVHEVEEVKAGDRTGIGSRLYLFKTGGQLHRYTVYFHDGKNYVTATAVGPSGQEESADSYETKMPRAELKAAAVDAAKQLLAGF